METFGATQRLLKKRLNIVFPSWWKMPEWQPLTFQYIQRTSVREAEVWSFRHLALCFENFPFQKYLCLSDLHCLEGESKSEISFKDQTQKCVWAFSTAHSEKRKKIHYVSICDVNCLKVWDVLICQLLWVHCRKVMQQPSWDLNINLVKSWDHLDWGFDVCKGYFYVYVILFTEGISQLNCGLCWELVI